MKFRIGMERKMSIFECQLYWEEHENENASMIHALVFDLDRQIKGIRHGNSCVRALNIQRQPLVLSGHVHLYYVLEKLFERQWKYSSPINSKRGMTKHLNRYPSNTRRYIPVLLTRFS